MASNISFDLIRRMGIYKTKEDSAELDKAILKPHLINMLNYEQLNDLHLIKYN